jgi:VIT1/CCC1 family predicted Fe2+/Mn2+ transporter
MALDAKPDKAKQTPAEILNKLFMHLALPTAAIVFVLLYFVADAALWLSLVLAVVALLALGAASAAAGRARRRGA